MTWILLAILLVSELVRYVTVKTEEHMVVDPTFGQKLNIRFNITFHGLHCGGTVAQAEACGGVLHGRIESATESEPRLRLSCSLRAEVNLDAMDVAGDQQKTEEHEIWRTRLVRGSLTPIGEATKYLLPYEKQELDLKKQLAHIPKDYCGSCYGAETVTRKVRSRMMGGDGSWPRRQIRPDTSLLAPLSHPLFSSHSLSAGSCSAATRART